MVTIETRFYPFVLMSLRGDPTESEYRTLFASVAKIARKALHENTKHVSIAVSGTVMSPSCRKLVASLMARYPEELLAPGLGSYVIVESQTIRGALVALRWISPRMVIMNTMVTEEDPMTAGLTRLREHGVEVDRAQLMGARSWLRTEANLARRAPAVRA